MLFIRIGLFLAVFASLAACSSSNEVPLGPSSSASSGSGNDAGGSTKKNNGTTGSSASDGGAPTKSQGTATFTIDGTSYVATTVAAKRTADSIEIDATMNDGQYDQTMTLTYKPGDTGSGPCGSLFGSNDRAVVYSETFDDQGQTATEEEFMSGLGLGDDGETCTFEIDSTSPASGSANGMLDDSNSLIGGSTPVKPPVNFTVTWSNVP
jgi:hypothetical protein